VVTNKPVLADLSDIINPKLTVQSGVHREYIKKNDQALTHYVISGNGVIHAQ